MKLFPLLALLLAGCTATGQVAPDRTLEHSSQLLAAGRLEEGLLALEALAKAHPDQGQYRSHWLRQRALVVDRLLREGEAQLHEQRYDEARTRYEQVQRLDPGHPRAREGLQRIARELSHNQKINAAIDAQRANDIEPARFLLKQVLAEAPRHARARQLLAELDEAANRAGLSPLSANSPLLQPVTLEFRNTPLTTVFDMLAKSTGVNFVFDREVKLDGTTTIITRDTPLSDALGVLLAGNQLARRILSDRMVLIYPATPARQKTFEALNVKTFYLNNLDAKAAVALIKTIVKTRDIYADEKLNVVVIRDTPEAIAMAEKLIAANDLADPEVVLDVEVIEVSNEKLANLGLQFPDQVSASLPRGADGGSLTLGELRALGSNSLKINIADPALVFNLKHTDGATNTLANPRIRVKSREKAKSHIGDRVPVITTTTNPTSGSVAESVSYLDVGLKLDVEAQVFRDDEVSIKLNLEVSNIVKEVASKSGLLTYQIGTRNNSTVLRLKDGETQVLAGLIKQEEIESAARLPGIGLLPILGRLFSSEKRQRTKTELVLLITPHIVRNLSIPDAQFTEFQSGTEENIGGDPLRLRSRSGQVALPPAPAGAAPFVAPPTGPAPATPGIAAPTSTTPPAGTPHAPAITPAS